MRWLFEDKRALHGAAAARILSGCTVLGLLISNFRTRDVTFGAGSVWAKPLQDGVGDAPFYWPTELVASMGSTTFLFYYLAIIALAVLWTLGWQTRLVGVLMLIGEVSIIERAPLVGEQGDNILRIGLVLLLFMQTDEYWSLAARRRTRRGARDPVLPLWLSNGVHNVALATLGVQVVVVYFSAGMAKARGDLWQHGTALYYPLQLQEFRPFPFLNDLFTHFGVVVGVATYFVLLVEIGFGFALLHPLARRVAIAAVIVLHVSIAVLMALPWFSLSMLAFVAIFISTSTYLALEHRLRRLVRRDDLRHATAGQHQDDDGYRQGSRSGSQRAEALPGDDQTGEETAARAGHVHRQIVEALDRRPG
jgi:hypothetical protein